MNMSMARVTHTGTKRPMLDLKLLARRSLTSHSILGTFS